MFAIKSITMLKGYFILLFFCFPAVLFSQSIHEDQLLQHNASGFTNASDYESNPVDLVSREKGGCDLNRIVYGWHPYWVGSVYQNYQWDLLSHFSFFSYEVNSSNGQPVNTHGWSTSAAVDAALASGNTKVTLCVTLFSGHATFFGSATSQQTLITNLINLIQSRGADGVNIDFEGLPASQATNFANFMVNLSNQMHTAIPGSEVSTVLYAVDWNDVFDFTIMEPAVDHYIIMGYGYYYGGSSTAGPTDPLYQFGNSYNYTLSRSITYYLDKGCPNSKLVLGLPSYGYEWQTSALTVPAGTTSGGTARTYSFVKNNSSGNYSLPNHIWESDSYTDIYAFNNGNNNQCMISLDSAWRKRLEHVQHSGIAGIGIWALGYDNGYLGLWSAIEDYLTDCFEEPCSGSIHDFGGPTKNYYNDEDYIWTIAPIGAVSLDIDFSLFDVETNWDYLYIYDGASTASPQIAGSPFTGVSSPGQFTTSTGAVTFRFTSDISTVKPGFLATYTCTTQPAPIASFTSANLQVCIGDSIALWSTSTDADTVQWSVSSGQITNANSDTAYFIVGSSGYYQITLDVSNGSGSDQSSMWVDVTLVDPPVAQINLSANSVYLPNALVTFTNSSQNATGYFWSFGDGITSTDAQPWHEYTIDGVYSGFMVASNGICPPDTVFFQVTVGLVGIENNGLQQISLYPNPFSNNFEIRSAEPLDAIEITDVSGRSMPIEVQATDAGFRVEFDGAEGTYFVKLTKGEVFKIWKLIRQ